MSNANIKFPNDGITFGVFRVAYPFCPNFRTVSSCRVAVVEIQGSAEPRMAMDYTAFCCLQQWPMDQPIVETLMIAL
jgi:hypothetical protein